MKINITVDENADELEISVTCKRLTPEIERLLASIRMMEKQLTVIREGSDETCFLDISNVIYAESVERKCFVYTENEVLESCLKLYELEQQLSECGFIRVSKSCIVNLRFIKSIKTDINRRLKLTLGNGEQIIASRQYADELKKRLGVKQ